MGSPLNMVAMPAAFPICEATWSAVTDAMGSACRVKYISVEYVFSAYFSTAARSG